MEVLGFKDATAGRKGPFAFHMHNVGLFDEYKDITIEVDPSVNDLITTSALPPPSPNRQLETAVLAGGGVVETTHAGFNGTRYVNFSVTGGTATFTATGTDSGNLDEITIP